MALKEISTYRLDSAEGFEKSQPLKDEAKLSDMNYVQGSISYNRTILTGLWKLFHRLCCKDRYRKTNLSETLFYDDSTERWVRMRVNALLKGRCFNNFFHEKLFNKFNIYTSE